MATAKSKRIFSISFWHIWDKVLNWMIKHSIFCYLTAWSHTLGLKKVKKRNTIFYIWTQLPWEPRWIATKMWSLPHPHIKIYLFMILWRKSVTYTICNLKKPVFKQISIFTWFVSMVTAKMSRIPYYVFTENLRWSAKLYG